MLTQYHQDFLKYKNEIDFYITHFKTSGVIFDNRNRNQIRLFELGNSTINVKFFKKPNFINKIVYRFFRKSKARRSFEFANLLLEKKIGTPKPIAFFEEYDFIGLTNSYYVSEHLIYDLTFRELVEIPEFPNAETILRQFTRFTFEMHQKGIEFLDHSPGNTLIIDNKDETYSFYLVDLNRMKFHNSINFQTRMKNLSRLTPKKEMVAVMSNEYAKLSGEDETIIFETMWGLTADFQYRFHRKKRIKKKLKFWKK